MTHFPSHTCRFCNGFLRSNEGVHYAARHWAHHTCYLDAGQSLARLSNPQIDAFPFYELKKRGLLGEVTRIQNYRYELMQKAGI